LHQSETQYVQRAGERLFRAHTGNHDADESASSKIVIPHRDIAASQTPIAYRNIHRG
jgi:hypothetical protein